MKIRQQILLLTMKETALALIGLIIVAGVSFCMGRYSYDYSKIAFHTESRKSEPDYLVVDSNYPPSISWNPKICTMSPTTTVKDSLGKGTTFSVEFNCK